MLALLVVAGLWWLLAVFWILRGPQRVGAVLAAVAGIASLVPVAVALGRLRLEPGQGAWVLLFALLVIMAADVGAYFAGHRFGRIKLAPSVSPGKTWEGVIGGLLFSLIIAIVGARLLGWPVAVVAPLAVGAAAFSVVGDLMESLMKRHSGLKDSGHLFPGHGGILDRFDSLTAGIPLLTLGLLQAGLVGEGWPP
jgi:phosphatidate cytidylyltransferase